MWKNLGPENVEVANSYNNLGLVYRKLGNFEKAKEYLELGLCIRQKKLEITWNTTCHNL